MNIKSDAEVELMRQANRLTGEMLLSIEEIIKPGITTMDIEKRAQDFISKNNAQANFALVPGYKHATCVSIDEEVIHGIPSKKRYLEEGQIVSVDTGVLYKGYNGDAARTFAVGKISEEKQRLIDVTRGSFFKGMEILKAGVRLGDLGAAIQDFVESNGFSVVRTYCGHGIGKKLHEKPNVNNFGTKGRGSRLLENVTIAVEPMVNMGTYDVKTLDDGWTVVTCDSKPSAHYENTVLIKSNGVEILSLV